MSDAMDLLKLKEPFPASDLEWRIQRSGMGARGPWAMCLAYVDARAVQDRLDEVCGAENWKDEYEHLPNGVMCRLSIRVGESWIIKENGAPETDIESFKGGISKALVRTASTWGIGRYLYKLPATFAKFVDRGHENAHQAKIDGKDFYWIPPPLPSWALPPRNLNTAPTQEFLDETNKLIKESLTKSSSPALAVIDTTNKAKRQESPPPPTLEDGDPWPGGAGEELAPPLNQVKKTVPLPIMPGGYTITFGKYTNTKLRDMKPDDIKSYIKWIEDDAKLKARPITGKANEFITNARKYLMNL